MGNINKNTKEKLKILIVIFIITLVFSMPYLIPHRITDTYWNIEEGIEQYKYAPLKDGRIIKKVTDLKAGDEILIRLIDGKKNATIRD